MEHLSSATVNAIVKQIKDLQKNPAEGITVRFLVLSLFLFSYSIDRFVVVYVAFLVVREGGFGDDSPPEFSNSHCTRL